jgi:hypothetical protein
MNIPTLSESSVQTTAIGAPRQSLNNPAIDALGNVGKTLQGVSADVYDFKAQADKTKTKGYVANYNTGVVDLMNGDLKATGDPSNSDYKIESGFLRTEGDSAMHAVPQGMEALKKFRQKYIDGIEDNNQKMMFSQATAGDEAAYNLDLQRHQFKQSKVLEEKNHVALVNSYQNQAGLHYQDMNPGGQFEKDIEKIETATHDFLKGKISPVIMIDGKAQANPTYSDAVREATAPAYKDAIEKLALSDPMEAKKQLDALDAGGKINLNISARLHHELQPALDAYEVKSVVEGVSDLFPKDVNDPFDRVKINKAIEAMNLKPKTEDLAKAEVKRREADWEDSKKKYYASNAGAVYMDYARGYWDKQQEAPVNEIRASKEFRNLTKEEQEKVLDKVDTENRAIRADKHKQLTESRTAANEERRLRNEEKRNAKDDQREIDKARKERWDTAFNDYYNNPEKLAQMSKEEFAGVEGQVSHADYKKLSDIRKKTTTPQALHHATIQSDTLKGIFAHAGITDPDEIKKLSVTAKKFVEQEQVRKGGTLSAKETQDAIIQGIQWEAINTTQASVAGFKYGGKGEAKRRMDIKDKSSIIPDFDNIVSKLEEKRGRTFSDSQRKRLAEELINEANK